MGGEPFAGDDEFGGLVIGKDGPGGGGHHAEAGDVGIFAGGDIGKMTFAVVEEDKGSGGRAILTGHATATYKDIRVTVPIEIGGDGDACIAAVGDILEGVGCQGEIAFA